jgi:hypothetical protein
VSWVRRHTLALAGWGTAIVFIAPLLAPGYVLSYDMVFVPRYRLSGDLLGLTGQVPRSVPAEGVVALLSRGVPADVLEKGALVAIFVLSAVGAGRLVSRLLPEAGSGARVAAGLLYAWNPFVYERLLIGHWQLLLAYSALPFVARASLDLREGVSGAAPRLGLWLALAGIASPYGGVLSGALALLVVAVPPYAGAARRPLRAAGAALVLALVVNLPWIVPSLTRPGGLPASPGGLAAFGPRSDSPLGTFGSLLSLGGMWNTDLAPPGRSSWVWVPSFAVILVVAVIGWVGLWRRGGQWRSVGLLAAAAAGLVLAGGTTFPITGAIVRWAGLHLPGGGLLRDSQKFVAPLALVGAVGFGAGFHRLTATLRPARMRPALGISLVAAAVSLVPTLAWGAWGELVTSRYPGGWDAARRIMAADPAPGSVLVLPWHLYFPLRWNGERVVLDPAQRFFSRAALTTERLELRSGTLPSEDPLPRRADRVVASGRPLEPSLPGLGVRYVLLLKEADWTRFRRRTAGLERVLDGAELSLFRSQRPALPVAHPSPPAPAVIAGDAIVALALLALPAWLLRTRVRKGGLLSFAGRRREGSLES